MKKIIFLQFFLISFFAYSQNNPPKIFLNCTNGGCYEDYLRIQLSHFDFVRDRFQADIQILIISQTNGSGGQGFTLNFIGANKYKKQQDTLKFNTRQADTEDIIRKKLVRYIQMGLIPYIYKSDISDSIDIGFPKRMAAKALIKKDKWDYWVFTSSFWGNFSGESNSRTSTTSGSLNINRITPEAKFNAFGSFNTQFNKFTFQERDSLGNPFNNVIKTRNESHRAGLSYIKSMTSHWSMGATYSNRSSVRSNILWAERLAIAGEYNIFPYEKNTQKMFRVLAQTGLQTFKLREQNVRKKEIEFLPFYRLDVLLDLTQPWGTVNAGIGGYQYLNEPKLYQMSGNLNVSWRVFEGFSLNSYIEGSYIKDQATFLPLSSADPNAVLLGTAILPTNFSYYAYIGLSYTFGSINNSVVNPRMNTL